MKYGEKSGGPPLDRYKVHHETFGVTEVVAISQENAILQACTEWGISWGLNACECGAMKLGKSQKQICVRCGHEVFTAGERMCNRCRSAVAADKREHFRRYPIRKERV